MLFIFLLTFLVVVDVSSGRASGEGAAASGGGGVNDATHDTRKMMTKMRK